MGSAGITNVGPINTPTTGKGAIAGFDPIMNASKRRTKKRKKMESAGKQWDHRRRDPTYIDGRSKQARNLIKRLSKKKKMTEETLLEYGGGDEKKSGGDNTSQAYKFIAQKRKVLKKRNVRHVPRIVSKRFNRSLVQKHLTIRRKQRIDKRS